jgi:hypothetical protein
VKLDIVCTGSTTASRPVKSYTACGVYWLNTIYALYWFSPLAQINNSIRAWSLLYAFSSNNF